MKMKAAYYNEIARLLFPFTDGDGRVPTRTAVFQVHSETGDTMTFDTARKFIDLLLSDTRDFESPGAAGLTVEFAGVEPFLAVGVMDELTGYLQSQLAEKNHPLASQLRLSVMTSGAAYFEPEAQAYIGKYRDLLSLCFTDGATVAAAHYAAEYGGIRRTAFTVTPDNLKRTRDTVNGLIASGFTHVDIGCVFDAAWNLDHSIVFYHQLKALADDLIDNKLYDTVRVPLFEASAGCPMRPEGDSNWSGGLAYRLTLDACGDVYPDTLYMVTHLGTDATPISLGNIHKGFTRTNEQQKAADDLKNVTRRAQSEDRCYECPVAFGCPNSSACNYRQTGSFNKRATNLCPLHKARVLACVYYFNKINRLKGESIRFINHMPEDWALAVTSREELTELSALANRADS